MAFEEGTETLICKRCGAHHEARWYRLPVRDEQSVRCRDCRELLIKGRTCKEYELIET